LGADGLSKSEIGNRKPDCGCNGREATAKFSKRKEFRRGGSLDADGGNIIGGRWGGTLRGDSTGSLEFEKDPSEACANHGQTRKNWQGNFFCFCFAGLRLGLDTGVLGLLGAIPIGIVGAMSGNPPYGDPQQAIRVTNML